MAAQKGHCCYGAGRHPGPFISSSDTLPSITPWKKHTWHPVTQTPSPSHLILVGNSGGQSYDHTKSNRSQNQVPCCSLALEGAQGLDPLCAQWVMYFPAFPPSTFINYHYPYLDARSPKALSCCLATPSIHSMQKSPGMNKPRVTKAGHPIPSQHSWIKGTDERCRPSCGPDMSCARTYGDLHFFLSYCFLQDELHCSIKHTSF